MCVTAGDIMHCTHSRHTIPLQPFEGVTCVTFTDQLKRKGIEPQWLHICNRDDTFG